MKQSTTFAQVATNQFDYLSSALCANTPPCKKYSSSRKFLTLSITLRLLLVMFLTLTASTAWGATYTKVTTAPSDWSGEYLIVYETGNVAFNGALTKLDDVSNTVAVEISDNTITGDDNIDKAIFTISKSGNNYTIKSASGYYIGQTSNANGLQADKTETYSHTISLDNDGTVNLVSGGAYLRYNAASNQYRFRYYKSSSYTGQKAICLYKKETSYAVTSNLSHVTADDDNPITVSPDATDLNLFYTAENNTWNLPPNITVTMGGTPLSDEDYIWDQTSGELLIGIENDFAFTGDIAITINGWQQLATPTELNSECTSTSATLKWNSVPNASSYLVTIVDGGELSADVPNTKTLHTFEGLNSSTEYLWVVKAIGDGTTYIDSEESATGEFTTLPAGYTITYNTNGGNEIAAASGTALPNPLPTPTKEHYEFQGWYTNETCTQTATAGATINADIILYAKWEAVTYTITLDPNYPNSLTGVFKDKEGSVIADNLVIPIKYGTESQPLTNFYSTLSLDGYQFDAFYTKREGGQRRVNTGSLTKDLPLYGRWKQEYTITWNVIGEQVGTTTIVEGQEWTLPEVDESCNDKQFVGWTTTEILEEQDEAPATLYTETNQFPLETNTYYAVFANVEVTGTGEYVKLTEALTDYSGEYLIVYETGDMALNGGLEDLDRADNEINVTITNNTIESNATTEAAKFTITKVTDGYSIKSASGYYMGCTANDKGLYVSQDEQYLNQISWGIPWNGAEEGAIIKSQKEGPMLCYSTTAGRFRYYSSAQQPIALYKKTGTNMTNYTTSCIPTYTITWKNEDGTVLATDKVAENTRPEYNGSTPIKAADAQYTYTFEGWTPDIVKATADATYTATYTETLRTYTITWKNGETPLETDNNVPYGETPTYNGATPTKAPTAQYTYTFNAWTPAISRVTGNATYTATFTETINKYQVTFNMNGHGTAPATQTIAYGSKVPEPSAPTAGGYEFAGWYKDEACTEAYDFSSTITGDLPLYAKWLNIYTITWKANGLEYTTTEVTEGEQITPPSSLDLGDYCGQVFAGWTNAEMVETTNDAPTLYPNPTSFPTASEEAPKTFYAVFADYAD